MTNEQVLVELNTDFSTKGMSAQEIQATVAAGRADAISRDTMMDVFRRGEVLPEGRTNEEEARLIENLQGEAVSPFPSFASVRLNSRFYVQSHRQRDSEAVETPEENLGPSTRFCYQPCSMNPGEPQDEPLSICSACPQIRNRRHRMTCRMICNCRASDT